MPQSQQVRDRVKRLTGKHERAKSERATFDNHWQDVADLVQPTRDFTVRTRTQGEQRRRQIYDATAPRAADELAAAVHGLLMNPAIRWFSMAVVGSDGAVDPKIDERSRAWLYEATTIMLSVFNNPRFGFATNAYEVALDEVSFGQGVMLLRETPTGIFFQARQLANFWMMEDDSGQKTFQFAEFCMSPDDALASFGEEMVSDEIRRNAKNEGAEDVRIVHAVYERDERNPMRMDGPNKRFASVYFEPKTGHQISEGGFDEDPYVTPRWSKAPQEVYGRSPAMKVLPTIKGLNVKAKTTLMAGEIATRPPLLVPANSMEGTLVIKPGATIPYKAGLGDKPEPLNTGVRPDTGLAMMEQDRLEIERAFFLDVFNLPDRDRMTATEIIERRAQGLIKASPVMSRQYSEWLTPLIRRVFRFLLKRRALPDAPASLQGRTLTVDYVSPMALSQKASEVQAFTSSLQAAAPLLESDPTLWRTTIDAEGSLREIFAMYNAKPSFLFNRQIAAQKRQELDEQQAQAAQAQAAQQGGSGFRDVAAGLSDLAGLGSTGAA